MSCVNIMIATIKFITLKVDIKLETKMKVTMSWCVSDTKRKTCLHGYILFHDESIKGWQLIWSGHERKKEHGVGILLAPYVDLDDYREHLKAKIISANVTVKGIRLSILNLNAPKNIPRDIKNDILLQPE